MSHMSLVSPKSPTSEARPASVAHTIQGYLALTKPRITFFILMSAAIGFMCGAHPAAIRDLWLTLLHTLIGIALIASGAAALNQWYERDADAKMNRTMARPIPAGRITPAHALWFGSALSIAGFAELSLGANLLAGLLGAFTLAMYVFVYTPLKRLSPHATTIGAIPGAMPPLIGFAAAAGTLTAPAWILFAILFLWQFPHFYAIAWMYRDDYARAGIRMLPVVEPDGVSTARRVVLFSLVLLPVSLLPKFTAMAGDVYFFGAIVMGAVFAYAAVRMWFDHSAAHARQVLLASVVYLPVLYGLLAIDRPHI
jgi:protoheme IX farnesyltransferase